MCQATKNVGLEPELRNYENINDLIFKMEVYMGLLGFISGRKEVKGIIGSFGLENWWLSEFTDEQRMYIKEEYRPMGMSGDLLTSGDVLSPSQIEDLFPSGLTDEERRDMGIQTSVNFLSGLACWFSKENDRPIAYKILSKAEELSKTEGDVLDIHFLYQTKISVCYKDRNKQGFLEKAMDACNQQISIAEKAAEAFLKQYKDSPLPGHKGYEQLAIILEKQKKFDETIELCKKAMAQGWGGDWEKRIERCHKKRNKA
jgi:tetratricopeptide (TPR) repeat protein